MEVKQFLAGEAPHPETRCKWKIYSGTRLVETFDNGTLAEAMGVVHDIKKDGAIMKVSFDEDNGVISLIRHMVDRVVIEVIELPRIITEES